jgi:hypothetical protein
MVKSEQEQRWTVGGASFPDVTASKDSVAPGVRSFQFGNRTISLASNVLFSTTTSTTLT